MSIKFIKESFEQLALHVKNTDGFLIKDVRTLWISELTHPGNKQKEVRLPYLFTCVYQLEYPVAAGLI